MNKVALVFVCLVSGLGAALTGCSMLDKLRPESIDIIQASETSSVHMEVYEVDRNSSSSSSVTTVPPMDYEPDLGSASAPVRDLVKCIAKQDTKRISQLLGIPEGLLNDSNFVQWLQASGYVGLADATKFGLGSQDISRDSQVVGVQVDGEIIRFTVNKIGGIWTIVDCDGIQHIDFELPSNKVSANGVDLSEFVRLSHGVYSFAELNLPKVPLKWEFDTVFGKLPGEVVSIDGVKPVFEVKLNEMQQNKAIEDLEGIIESITNLNINGDSDISMYESYVTDSSVLKQIVAPFDECVDSSISEDYTTGNSGESSLTYEEWVQQELAKSSSSSSSVFIWNDSSGTVDTTESAESSGQSSRKSLSLRDRPKFSIELYPDTTNSTLKDCIKLVGFDRVRLRLKYSAQLVYTSQAVNTRAYLDLTVRYINGLPKIQTLHENTGSWNVFKYHENSEEWHD